MTFLDKAKDLAKKASDKVDDFNQGQQEKKEQEYELNKDNPDWLFEATNTIGDLQVDSINQLFKINNARSEFVKEKRKGLISKTANVALVVGTAGMSTAIKATAKGIKKVTRKPDSAYSFNELVEFELLEDGSQITSGGIGRAIVGGVALGAVGAIVGGSTGKRKTKKVIESMMIRVTINDLDNPIIILPIITSKTKVGSKQYVEAFNTSQKIISTLNVIANNKEELVQKVEVINDVSSNDVNDPYEEVKKLKELLDAGIVTEEEYENKRKELLDL